MASSIEPRQRILETLSERRYETVNNLAVEFQVCRNTIRNDLDELTLTAPIFTVKGNGGGVRVVDGWYKDCRYLRQEDEALLVRLLPKLNAKEQKQMQRILSTFAKPRVGNLDEDSRQKGF